MDPTLLNMHQEMMHQNAIQQEHLRQHEEFSRQTREHMEEAQREADRIFQHQIDAVNKAASVQTKEEETPTWVKVSKVLGLIGLGILGYKAYEALTADKELESIILID